jgi:uncharacterized membrane protein
MNDVKPWYQSKGVWGSIMAFVAIVAGVFGFDLTDADQESFAEIAVAIGGALAALLGLVGRLTARARVG